MADWMDAEIPEGRLLIGPTRAIPAGMRRYALGGPTCSPIWRDARVIKYLHGLDAVGRLRLRQMVRGVDFRVSDTQLVDQAMRDLAMGSLSAFLIPRAIAPLSPPSVDPPRHDQGDEDPPGQPAQWSVTDRVVATLRRCVPLLPRDMQQAAKSLFTRETLYWLAGFLVVWAGGHLAGYGEAIDVILLGVGYAMVGWSVFQGLNDLGHGIALAITAKTQHDLDEAAKRTAAGLTILTINALIALIAKVKPASGGKRPMVEEPPPPPADPPLPPKAPKPDLKTLRERYADRIKKGDTFKTLGVSEEEAEGFLDTEPGNRLLSELSKADPTASVKLIRDRAISMVQSGSGLPEMANMASPLVKIVPKGASISPYSPYFTTMENLNKATSSGKNLADYFGLPVSSGASVYDVYQISPKVGVDPPAVFVSKIAPTSELGGLVERSGGATQYIVPNRGLWDAPVPIGTIGF
ncbi:hypothetical protein [Nitrospirillum viridazoti]|nr:hypothetical protein [Nitrospirillum amazonense]TWB26478.1 hypothetical protein FBZ91_1413 [Nitrospirillum amazonense]